MSGPRLAWVRCQTRPHVAYMTRWCPDNPLFSVWWDDERGDWRAQQGDAPARRADGSLLGFDSMERAMAWCERTAAAAATGALLCQGPIGTDLAPEHGGGEPCDNSGSG